MASLSRVRRLVPAAAALTSVLLLATACGDSDDASSKDSAAASPAETSASPTASASADSSAAPAGGAASGTGKAAVQKALLAAADLPGDVRTVPFENPSIDVTAVDPACQPILEAFTGGTGTGGATAYAGNRYIINGNDSDVSVILVAAHKPGGAEKVMNEALKALPKCAKFDGTKAGSKAGYTAAKAEVPSDADAGFGVELTTGPPGSTTGIPTNYALLRVGDNLVVFVNVNVTANTADFPERAIVDAQVAKLRATR